MAMGLSIDVRCVVVRLKPDQPGLHALLLTPVSCLTQACSNWAAPCPIAPDFNAHRTQHHDAGLQSQQRAAAAPSFCSPSSSAALRDHLRGRELHGRQHRKPARRTPFPREPAAARRRRRHMCHWPQPPSLALPFPPELQHIDDFSREQLRKTAAWPQLLQPELRPARTPATPLLHSCPLLRGVSPCPLQWPCWTRRPR